MQMEKKPPGSANQDQIRTNARIFGVLLTGLGVATIGVGVVGFVLTAFSDSYDPFADPGVPKPMIWMGVFLVGGVLSVVGRGLLGAGYGGAALRYAAGEAAPVFKETKEYLAADTSADPARAQGPFCRACGVRNDVEANFCDGCGASLA